MAASFRIASSVVVLACLAVVSGKPVVLERLSQTYLPFQFRPDGSPEFCLGEAAAEQLAYDKDSNVVYVSGNKVSGSDIDTCECTEFMLSVGHGAVTVIISLL